MANTNQKEYKSLGQMLSKKDFKGFLVKLEEYEKDTEDLKTLKSPAYAGSNFSILDELLYNLPRYLTIQEKEKNEDEDASNFAPPVPAPIVAPTIVPAILDEDGLKLLDKLLELGANPNATVFNGLSPMIFAATVNNPEILKRFINNPYKEMDLTTGDWRYQLGNLSAADGRNQDLLYYASMSNALDTMEFLIQELGFNMDKQYLFNNNKTLLHMLCQDLNESMTLSQKGFDLELDVIPHREPALRKLIELGANPTIEDDFENVPEMLVPSLDDSPHNIETIPEETVKNWDKIYEDVGNYRKYYEINNKKQFKTTF